MALVTLQTEPQYTKFVESGLSVVHFWAPWAEECKHIDTVITELAKLNPVIKFGKLEAEEHQDISGDNEIVAVPTIIMFQAGKSLGRVDGADAFAVTKLVDSHKGKVAALTKVDTGGAAAGAQVAGAAAAPDADLETRLKQLINAAPVMLFMKGTSEEPKCGFSRKMVALLQEQDLKFSSFDILADDAVRQGLKTFSDWPTFPQLYIGGELIGGLDILKEMVESDTLKDVLPKEESLNDRLKALINRDPVMVFIKGTPEAPRCGFSRTIVGLLNELEGVTYGYYDILGDEQVRAGLKTYSDWPTFPQLYAKGELLGGLDIVKEMHASGELVSELV